MPGPPAFSSAPYNQQTISTGGGAAAPTPNAGTGPLTQGMQSVADALAKRRKGQQSPYGQGPGQASYMTPPSSAGDTMSGTGGNILNRASASPYAGLQYPSTPPTPTGPQGGGGGPGGPPSTGIPPGAGAGVGAGAAPVTPSAPLPPPRPPAPAGAGFSAQPLPSSPGIGGAPTPTTNPGQMGPPMQGAAPNPLAQAGQPMFGTTPLPPGGQSPVTAGRYGPLPSPAPTPAPAPNQMGGTFGPAMPSPFSLPSNMYGGLS